MKTIKHLLTGEIKRVSDAEAEAEAIRAKDKLEPKIWVYVPKSEWKKKQAEMGR